jgi:PAS domain S-box-containing protein
MIQYNDNKSIKNIQVKSIKNKKLFFIDIINKLNQFSIRSRLAFFFILLSVIPILLLGFISFGISKTSITNMIMNYSMREMKQISQNLELTCAKYENFSLELITNDQISKYMLKYLSGRSKLEILDGSQKLEEYFKTAFALDPNMIISFYSLGDSRSISVGDNRYQPLHNDFKDSPLFEKTISKDGRTNWDYFKDKIAVSRLIINPVQGTRLGVMALFFDISKFDKIINISLYNNTEYSSDNISELPYTIAVNKNGNIIITPFKEDYGKNISILVKNKNIMNSILTSDLKRNKILDKIRNNDVVITYNVMPEKEWYLLDIAPGSYLYSETKSVGLWTIFLVFLIGGLAVFISLIVALGISYPLNQVMNVMKEAEKDLSVRININTKDELYELGKSFNQMLSKINELNHLVQAKEFLDKVIDSISNPFFIKNSKHEYILANNAIKKFFLKDDSEQIIGLTDFDILSKEFSDFNFKIDDKIIKEYLPEYESETSYVFPDGSINYLWLKKNLYIDNDDNKFIVCSIHDITKMKQSENMLKQHIFEKELLLKEIHHRVKNNLNIIASIISLKSMDYTDPTIKNILEEIKSKIYTVAVIHEKLYKSLDYKNIDFIQYLRELIDSIISTFQITSHNIQLKAATYDIFLNIDKALPCGLIINELLTNSLKYAFPDNRKGNILISVDKINEMIILTIEDNGVGFPDNFDVNNINSLGLKLVSQLTKQIEGNLEIKSKNGAFIKIMFIN